ncbi:MAG: glycosyltransferase [Nitrososphaeria archaeon]
MGYIERLTAKLPNLIISISEFIKEELKLLGVHEKKIKVVPNGVDYYRIEKVKRNNNSFDVIYVGRLISHKNVDILLRAISRLKKKISRY